LSRMRRTNTRRRHLLSIWMIPDLHNLCRTYIRRGRMHVENV
jgi:hypothetical protein